MYLTNFDPLQAKYSGTEEVVFISLKREIQNILSSYVGWFDPFCELIQNALDSIEERMRFKEKGYVPSVTILIDLKNNRITVTDNGVGFEEQQYVKFLAPNFSFKNGHTRGHKGVGSTYLAYGFNYIQISTKSPEFVARGKMLNARKWLANDNPASNPLVVPDAEDTVDSSFNDIDRGVSICIKYDDTTTPKDLSWIKISTAENWLKVLRIKTGLGAIISNLDINVKVKVIAKNGQTSTAEHKGIEYLWINEILDKTQTYTAIRMKSDELYKKKGRDYKLPSKFLNLNAIYDKWTYERLASEITLEQEERDIVERCHPETYFCYVYSTKVWEKFNNSLGTRAGISIMNGGIQLAANNMPQGELILIPLKKSAGRQFQLHILMHFENCSADLGRKGFQKDITDFSKSIAKKIADGPLKKVQKCFRKNSGVLPDLMREKALDDWKKVMNNHEQENPLILDNPNFFLPIKKISMTSVPTREQDVIALFNQLLAGGVIRGIKIMSTNERFTYDGLFHIAIEPPFENQIYNVEKNPLGIVGDIVETVKEKFPDGFYSDPRVLEYKYSLDGLIEDIESGLKNTNDINLVIAWEAGESYKENFFIMSMLIDENLNLRQYHGATHRLFDINTNEIVCELILLKDLIEFLNNPKDSLVNQQQYEEL